VHGAGAAQSGAAAEFRAGEFEMFADNPEQWRFGICLDARGFAIDRKGNRRHEYTSPSFGARADMACELFAPRSLKAARFSDVRISDVLPLFVGEF
jgi:hypothetical protein